MNQNTLLKNENEELLVEKLKKRDQRAFETVMTAFSGKVIQKARILLNTADLAEDMAQEVFLKAHKEMHNIRGKRIFPWLMAITFNQCMDVLRQRKRAPKEIMVSEDNRLLSENQKIPDQSLDLLVSLTETERSVVFLRVVEKLKFDEIVEITGLVEGSVRNLLSKSLRKLREEVTKSEL